MSNIIGVEESKNLINENHARFISWMPPFLEVLKEKGGAATTKEVFAGIAKRMKLGDDVLSERHEKSGQLKFNNQVYWAKQYLVWENLVCVSKRGIWALTDKGLKTSLNYDDARAIFFKWVKINQENRKNQEQKTDYEDFDCEITAQEVPAKRRFWLYSPGSVNKFWFWDEFYSQGIMGIGWDDLGDLSQYPDRETVRAEMNKVYYDPSKNHKMSSLALWQFFHTMRDGDIVFAKKGLYEIVGRGVVESEYIFIPERQGFKHIRKVKWTHCGTWKHPGQAGIKTLTDITQYTEYVEKLEALFHNETDLIEDNEEPEIKYPKYSKDDFLDEVYIDSKSYNTIKGLLERKKNIILQGAPGVGKTFAAQRLAFSIMGEEDTSRVKIIQFHQSYSYEDFVMGHRPDDNGRFPVAEGPFYNFCKKAEDDDDKRPYFFIIDEINRGNLSKIFGELLMLIEADKRKEKYALRLLYRNEKFYIPKNIHIIGMMNTADRSLAMIDYALRRRFAFFDMEPAFSSDGFKARQAAIKNPKFDALITAVESLNKAIAEDASLGVGFRIGHSYFCTVDEFDDAQLTSIVEYELIPLLNEYWFDEPSKVEEWKVRLRKAANG